jgi:hypothetical protein
MTKNSERQALQYIPGLKCRGFTARIIGKFGFSATAHVIWSLNYSTRVSSSMIDPAVFQVHTLGRQPPIRRARYLFRRARAQTSGFIVLRFYTMDSHELRRSRTGETL